MKKHVLVVLALLAGAAFTGRTLVIGLHKGRDADVLRQWNVSRYLRHRVNPYPIALESLRDRYGTTHGAARIRLRDVQIYGMPPDTAVSLPGRDRPVLAGLPEATYPPATTLTLALTIGWLPEWAVLPVWALINLMAVGVLAVLLAGWDGDGSVGHDWLTGAGVLLLILLWPPTQVTIANSQFSLLILVFLLCALRTPEGHDVKAGLWLSCALLKPSLAVLFLLPFLYRRRWRVVATVLAVHLCALLACSLWVRTGPFALVSDWLEVTRYFLQGMYSLQEVINGLGIDNSMAGALLTLMVVGAFVGWAAIHREADTSSMFDFIGVATLVSVYHERYDFVLLLPMVIATALAVARSREFPLDAGAMGLLTIASLVVLGLGLTDTVISSEANTFHALRWSARFALIGLAATTGYRLRRTAAESGWTRVGEAGSASLVASGQDRSARRRRQ